METFLSIALGNIVMAGILAIAAAIATMVCRRPAIVHALWLLVLLKLLTPPLWKVPISQPAAVAPTPVAIEQSPAPSSGTLVYPEAEYFPIPDAPAQPDAAAIVADMPAATDSAPAQPRPHFLVPAAGALWLVGSVICAIVIASRLRRFGRLLRHARLAPSSLQSRLDDLAARMELRRRPTIWLVPGMVCPMLWAWAGRARIIVPTALWSRLSESQRSALLSHELAHYARRDHWVRLLELAVVILYWWCPLAWWTRRQLREAEEQCCDAWVVWTMPGSGRDYAMALLEAVDFMSVGKPLVPALASGMGQFHQLKRRLIMIKNAHVPRMLSWTTRSMLALAGLLLLPLAPTLAQTTRPDASNQPTLSGSGDFFPGTQAQNPFFNNPNGLYVVPNSNNIYSGTGTAPQGQWVTESSIYTNSTGGNRLLVAPSGGLTTGTGALTVRPQTVAPSTLRVVVEESPELAAARAEAQALRQKLEQANRRIAELEQKTTVIGIDANSGKVLWKYLPGAANTPKPAVFIQSGTTIKSPPPGNTPIVVPRTIETPSSHRPVSAPQSLEQLETRLEGLLRDVQKLKQEQQHLKSDPARSQ